MTIDPAPLACAFCGKHADEVFRLVASDDCTICSECIGRCADMVANEYRKVAQDIQFPPAPNTSGDTP